MSTFLRYFCTENFLAPQEGGRSLVVAVGGYPAVRGKGGKLSIDLGVTDIVVEEALLLKHGRVEAFEKGVSATKKWDFVCTKSFVPESSRRGTLYASFTEGSRYNAVEVESGFQLDLPAPSYVTAYVTREELFSHGELVERGVATPSSLPAPSPAPPRDFSGAPVFDRSYTCREEFTLPVGHGALPAPAVVVGVGQHPVALLDAAFFGGRRFAVLDLGGRAGGQRTVDLDLLETYGQVSEPMDPPEVPSSVGASSKPAGRLSEPAKKKKRPSLSSRLFPARKAVPIGLYEHANGTRYDVRGYTLHTGTDEVLVTYHEDVPESEQDMRELDEGFSRPYQEFADIVERHDGTMGPRFILVENLEEAVEEAVEEQGD